MPTRMEWIAATDALKAHPTAFDQAKLLDCKQRVLRTGRSKSTGGWHPASSSLVEPNHLDSKVPTHRFSTSTNIPVNSSLSSESVALLADSRTSTAMSKSTFAKPVALYASRALRFCWFLRAWQPSFLTVAMPMRPVPGKEQILKKRPFTRFPSVKIASNRLFFGPFRRPDVFALGLVFA